MLKLLNPTIYVLRIRTCNALLHSVIINNVFHKKVFAPLFARAKFSALVNSIRFYDYRLTLVQGSMGENMILIINFKTKCQRYIDLHLLRLLK